MNEVEPDAADYGLPRRWITLVLFAFALVFAVGLFLSEDDKGTLAVCLLGCAALAVFWPLVAKVDNLKIGATGVELSKKVEDATKKADDASDKAYNAIETITRFVFNSMPQPTFQNLRKIASGHFGPFRADDGFRQQLRYLRDSGYVMTNGIYISGLPKDGNELSDYIYCTELGREFIDRRLAAEGGTDRASRGA